MKNKKEIRKKKTNAIGFLINSFSPHVVSPKSIHLFLCGLEFCDQFEFSNDFQIAHVIHPSTYINKILVASVQGAMQLWNIRTQ